MTNRTATATRRPKLSTDRSLNEVAIAAAIRLNPARIAELLAEDGRRGIVVRAGGGWRLSDEAERAFGPALRGLGDGPVRLGRRTPRRYR